MWFKFPNGMNQISVENQLFATEVRDKNGGEFFRAPDHFAPNILNLGLGFSRSNPPEGAPADLPEISNETSPVDKLSAELESARKENERLLVENKRLADERDSFKTELEDANKQIASFSEKQPEPDKNTSITKNELSKPVLKEK